MAQHFTASRCRSCIHPCLPRCVVSREVQGLNSWYALTIWKRAFLLKRQVKISTTAHRWQPLCLQGTHGIALIQHSNEACYITSRIRVGTNNHLNHSTTVFATPARYDNHRTVVLGRACSLSTISFMYRLHECILYKPRALFGFTGGLHDWNLAFVLQG